MAIGGAAGSTLNACTVMQEHHRRQLSNSPDYNYCPFQSKGMCLLDLPFLSHSNPIAFTSLTTVLPHVATVPGPVSHTGIKIMVRDIMVGVASCCYPRLECSHCNQYLRAVDDDGV